MSWKGFQFHGKKKTDRPEETSKTAITNSVHILPRNFFSSSFPLPLINLTHGITTKHLPFHWQMTYSENRGLSGSASSCPQLLILRDNTQQAVGLQSKSAKEKRQQRLHSFHWLIGGDLSCVERDYGDSDSHTTVRGGELFFVIDLTHIEAVQEKVDRENCSRECIKV